MRDSNNTLVPEWRCVFAGVIGCRVLQVAGLGDLHIIGSFTGQGHNRIVHLQGPRVHYRFNVEVLPINLGLLQVIVGARW